MDWTQALEIDLVAQQFSNAQTFAREEAPLSLNKALALQMDGRRERAHPESPIEIVFSIWWEAVSRADFWYPWGELALEPQCVVTLPLATYRLDFRLTCQDVCAARLGEGRGVAFPKIGIELDGHDFHEKTKEQATARNQRDRDLQMDGWTIFHFSGSELVRQPIESIRHVLNYARARQREYIVAAATP